MRQVKLPSYPDSDSVQWTDLGQCYGVALVAIAPALVGPALLMLDQGAIETISFLGVRRCPSQDRPWSSLKAAYAGGKWNNKILLDGDHSATIVVAEDVDEWIAFAGGPRQPIGVPICALGGWDGGAVPIAADSVGRLSVHSNPTSASVDPIAVGTVNPVKIGEYFGRGPTDEYIVANPDKARVVYIGTNEFLTADSGLPLGPGERERFPGGCDLYALAETLEDDVGGETVAVRVWTSVGWLAPG